MIDLGRHAFFILASYAASIALIGGLAAWIVADHRARARELAALDDNRGPRR